jgi:sec-independent protein translocase protein TatA
MGAFSIWHVLVILLVVLILFGAGKLPQVMGDLAKGLKNFKQGMKDDDSKSDKSTATRSDSPKTKE